MALAVADPVTLFIPWLKVAKAGKLAVTGVGAGVATGDVALREQALYGEVNPMTLGLAAGLGGASSLISSLFIPMNRAVSETVEVVGKNGKKVRKPVEIAGPPKPIEIRNCLLYTTDAADYLL